MAEFIILAGADKTLESLKAGLDDYMTRLRAELKSRSIMSPQQRFLREGLEVPMKTEGERKVRWLLGLKDGAPFDDGKVPTIQISPKEEPDRQVTIKKGTESLAVGIPVETGGLVSDLRNLLEERREIKDTDNFVERNGATLARKDESTTKWELLLRPDGDKKQMLQMIDAQPKGYYTVPKGNEKGVSGGSSGSSGSTSPTGGTGTSPGTAKPGSGTQKPGTELKFDTDAPSLGATVDGARKTFSSLSRESRTKWLQEHGVFRGLVIGPKGVTFSRDNLVSLEPQTLDPRVYIPEETLLYRYTQSYSSLEHSVLRVIEDRGTVEVGGGTALFGGETSNSGGARRSDKRTQSEKSMYLSQSALVRVLQVSLNFDNLVLDTNAENEVRKTLRSIEGKDDLQAVDEIAKLFGTIGAFFALSSYFGGRLEINDCVDRTSEEKEKEIAWDVKSKTTAKFGDFFKAAAGYERSDKSFDSVVKIDEKRSLTIEYAGGAARTINKPTEWLKSLDDIDNCVRVMSLDLVPVAAFFTRPVMEQILGPLVRAQNRNIFQKYPIDLEGLAGWYMRLTSDGL